MSNETNKLRYLTSYFRRGDYVTLMKLISPKLSDPAAFRLHVLDHYYKYGWKSASDAFGVPKSTLYAGSTEDSESKEFTLSPEEAEKFIRVVYKGEIHGPREFERFRDEKKDETKEESVIEFAGMPNALKSTGLSTVISRIGESFPISLFAEPRPDIDKGKYPIEYTFDLLHRQMSRALQKRDDKTVLLDRAAYDRIPFLMAYRDLGIIDHPQMVAHLSHLFALWTNHIDAVIVHDCSPEISLKREGPREIEGRIMNVKFLRLLNQRYRSLMVTTAYYQRQFKHHNRPVIFTNINTDFLENPQYLPYRPRTSNHIFNEMQILDEVLFDDYERYEHFIPKLIGYIRNFSRTI